MGEAQAGLGCLRCIARGAQFEEFRVKAQLCATTAEKSNQGYTQGRLASVAASHRHVIGTVGCGSNRKLDMLIGCDTATDGCASYLYL